VSLLLWENGVGQIALEAIPILGLLIFNSERKSIGSLGKVLVYTKIWVGEASKYSLFLESLNYKIYPGTY